ncbi:MAG: translation elongation factor Ts [Pseudomonadota bacterium]|uniref:Translation elongation factor EFTs/EF1B dimerisation domain-containing protein n=1 Tax=marine metagenome TaxID=408172 RepID=A0A381UC48_9ZZZZ|nr:translation elongation factor Ts [Pseudomonadota bacterium]MEE3132768.1 translation elongation factor Ts [Pseudomonadota bacterium]|tara:strand:- start:4914 stop:5747 length:834 start_codon:yes stop_codon:yes gene_type:complete
MAKIKEVRSRTGVGFGDCKKALEDARDDIDKAIEIIRKQSAVKAAKKADRTAAEGLLAMHVSENGDSGAMVEVNSETDFAARNERFIDFANEAVKWVVKHGDSEMEGLEEARAQLVQIIGENVSVRRAVRFVSEGGAVGSYLHANDKLGALVEIRGGDAVLGKEIAMHVTAMNPMVLSADQMPDQVLRTERGIYAAQALESGKPESIVQKMVDGRVRKFLAESSLLDQPFVRDPDTKVGDLLEQAGAQCLRFIRFEVGEGVEKKDEDFAAEVAAQFE